MTTHRIKVMIVDDSAVVRQTLGQIVQSDGQLELVGAHSNPLFAMKALEQVWPDVLVLDVEMPGMDGITFLKTLMKTKPLPVIICSSLTTKGAAMTLEAMAAGAVEIIAKPTAGLKAHLHSIGSEMLIAIKAAAKANMNRVFQRTIADEKNTLIKTAQQLLLSTENVAMQQTTDRIIALGTSTGGTQVLEFICRALPVTVPGIVVVQHMPEAFTRAFAERLDKCSVVTVKEAENNERILPGHVYIANGGLHLQIRRQGAYYYTMLKDGPAVSRHKPSVNVLFDSVASSAGKNAIGVILTGMGDDGARGLLTMRQAGAVTYAQDEHSCVVYGMPKEAVKAGAVQHILPLDQIAEVLAAIRAA
ncbi:protein-glutamate methylesterase/protein-glutamine glutaminase [Alishewanella tabrizica]|uniref:Protein-glutamate methylesterase/protein-glutamine glutaminase n=1 Tax=Alishewanella tabrizica TaxID=671278 RepID=A0ABQ2WJT2_9ALTE|nr:chemotaxis response regulator protein-glutamate methylesterase [Alishewanella tabrizica]GGW57025.1 chemotaxis response regulator protein-glutamate methylesterase of group 3 operon [Alishewanella tabrizica]